MGIDSKVYSSNRATKFTESVIREMTRICLKHKGVNLAQGFPDFPAPAEIKEAAVQGDPGRFQPVCHHLGRRQIFAKPLPKNLPGITASP